MALPESKELTQTAVCTDRMVLNLIRTLLSHEITGISCHNEVEYELDSSGTTIGAVPTGRKSVVIFMKD